MPITIGQNIASLLTQRKLTQTGEEQARALERLSSGMRINRGSDDAAGLAIAKALQIDSRIFSQAVRNLGDGVSLLSIAEAAVTQLKEIVMRTKELATQGANGVYSSTQRLALHREAIALQEEYNRIIKSSTFNGRNVFDESNGDLVLQAGYGSNATISVEADQTLDLGALPSRISISGAGAEATGGGSSNVRITPNARYALFESAASNLVSGDGNGQTDIFRKDLLTGEIVRVNTDSAGNEAVGGSSNGANMTPDGRYVVFHSTATNLVSDDSNGRSDIFIKDLVTGAMRWVSVDSAGNEATGGASGSYAAQIADDGRYVFESDAVNLVSDDTNGRFDVFRKDLLSGETTRISVDSAGAQATGGNSANVVISSDGRYVLFNSASTNLVAGDTNGTGDVFMKDLLSGFVQRVSTDSWGNQANNSGGGTQVTLDGRFAFFFSNATNLVSNDTNGTGDIFRKDLLTGETIRMNTTAAGGEATGGSSAIGRLTEDGRYYVFSSSATNLVAGDTNAQSDVFVKDLATGEVRRISVNSSGAQASGGASSSPHVTSDGRYVVFNSAATDLVNGDTNAQNDAFVTLNPFATSYAINLLYDVSMQTQASSQYMQTYLDNYLNELNAYQAQIGASQQRLNIAARVLQTQQLNNDGAASRIMDADVAEESSTLIRTRILQQAASAILAQANQQPALALELL